MIPMKECKHRWKVNRKESVWGMTAINAVIECAKCPKRQGPMLIRMEDLLIMGDKTKTYWLK